ncbi:MAG: hypothetical protein DME00_35520 [Candidatus Rokuibacteriota bacterium]|nr:MAG: hypothetical protein DME00_35520 [Candidatus Rokubacteria bacterium]
MRAAYRGDELLTFFSFPKVQRKTLRTTNTIERLHEEFRRRVKTRHLFDSVGVPAVPSYVTGMGHSPRVRRVPDGSGRRGMQCRGRRGRRYDRPAARARRRAFRDPKRENIGRGTERAYLPGARMAPLPLAPAPLKEWCRRRRTFPRRLDHSRPL